MSRNYDDPQYKEFRSKVLVRDEHICRWPRCLNTTKLKVHHIKKWSTHPKMRYDVSNGITLCRYHHDMIWSKEEFYEKLFICLIINPEDKSLIKKPKKKYNKRQKNSYIARYLKELKKYRRKK